MNLSVHYPPHIRSNNSSAGIMFDAVVALLPLYGMAIYFYGLRAAMLGALSACTCLVADHICSIVMGRGINIRDISSVVTGLIIALLMPASVSYRVVIAAGCFAIFVVKHPFGGLGQNVLNPAAGGVAFATVCWPTVVLSYPAPFNMLAVEPVIEVAFRRSAAYALKLGTASGLNYVDLALGNIPGPMGATHILVMLGCMFYLWVRRSLKMGTTFGFIAGAAAVGYLVPRSGLGPTQSVLCELMSGSLMFSAIFLLSDPVTSPKRPIARVIYGAAGGIVCVLLRHVSLFEESVIFGILIMNTTVWLLDVNIEKIYHTYRRARVEQDYTEEATQVAGS